MMCGYDSLPFDPTFISERFLDYIRDSGNNYSFPSLLLILDLIYQYGDLLKLGRYMQITRLSDHDYLYLSTLKTNKDLLLHVYQHVDNEQQNKILLIHIANGKDEIFKSLNILCMTCLAPTEDNGYYHF